MAHPSCNQARQGTTIHARVLYRLMTKNTSLSVLLSSEPSLGPVNTPLQLLTRNLNEKLFCKVVISYCCVS